MSLAISCLKLHDSEGGMEYFDKALEVRRKLNDDMGMSIDYRRFGDFYAFKREYNEAIKYHREAIRIDPDYAAAHNNLGGLLDNLKRYDEAEEEYIKAIRIDPDDGEAHANLGHLFLRIERPKEAKNEFEIAKELFEKQGRV